VEKPRQPKADIRQRLENVQMPRGQGPTSPSLF
jgi:hypothetical protein